MGAKPPYADVEAAHDRGASISRRRATARCWSRSAAAGLCHSDLSVINGDRPRPMPMALGHEAAGVVEELGEGVTDLRRGDHVVLVFVPSCGHCAALRRRPPRAVRAGRGGQRRRHACSPARAGCRATESRSTTISAARSFAEYATVSRRSLVKIDPELPLDEAALFGCAVLTGVGAVVNTAQVRAGASVAVIGLGGVGLASLLGARAAGARQIIAVDLSDDKLELAKSLGATHTFNAGSADASSRFAKLTSGGVEYAFEFAGSVRALEIAYKITRRGGTTVTAGLPPPTAMLPLARRQPGGRGAHAQGQLHRHLRALARHPALRRPVPAGPPAGRQADDGPLKLDEINHGFDLLHEGKAVRQVVVF